MRSEQVLPLWVRVDLRVMVMKGYSTSPKFQRLQPHHQDLESYPGLSFEGWGLLLYRDTVGKFFCPRNYWNYFLIGKMGLVGTEITNIRL